MGIRLPTLGLLASLAACAAEGGDGPDPNAVNVIVHDGDHQPVAGAVVYGRGDSGEEWATKTTDGDGVVRMFRAEDGTITVRDAAGTLWHSFVGVGGGDVVRVVIQPGQGADTVAIAAPESPTGAFSNVGTRCGRQIRGADGTRLALDRWCAGDGPTTVVLSKDDEYHWPDYFLVEENVTLESSMEVAGTWVPATNMAMIEMGAAGVGMAWQTVERTVLEAGYPVFTTVAGWAVTSPMAIPSPDAGDGAAYEVKTSDGRAYLEAALDPQRVVIEEDRLLAPITNVVIESQTVRWDGGGMGDAVSVTIEVGAPGASWTWKMTMPAGEHSVRFPDVADRPWPGTTNETVNRVEVEEMESSRFAGYGDAIAFDDWFDDKMPVPMTAGAYVRTSRATTAP